jgi:hypothetical protein
LPQVQWDDPKPLRHACSDAAQPSLCAEACTLAALRAAAQLSMIESTVHVNGHPHLPGLHTLHPGNNRSTFKLHHVEMSVHRNNTAQ